MRFTVALLAFVFAVPLSARGADPAVCRPYATAATEALIKFAWNRMYSSCLLAETETPVPPTAWRDVLDVVDPDRETLQTAVDDAARVANCKRLFPASFDAKTMTGIPYGKDHRRVPCP